MTEWVVQAEKLDKLFDDKQGKTHALKGIDFRAEKGKMTALIGPDGAGKTTTMRLICGLMDPTGCRYWVWIRWPGRRKSSLGSATCPRNSASMKI